MKRSLTSEEIRVVLPHRDRMLLLVGAEIDTEASLGCARIQIGHESKGTSWCEGMACPHLYVTEALAQLAGVLLLRKLEHTGKLAVLMGIDKVKLRAPVSPGDQLRLEVETMRMRGGIGKVRGMGTVAGKVVCEAELTFALTDV